MNTRFESEIDAMLIGPVKVEGVPISRELIGVYCLLYAITIRTMDRLGYKFHGGNPSVLIKLDKAAVCGSVD